MLLFYCGQQDLFSLPFSLIWLSRQLKYLYLVCQRHLTRMQSKKVCTGASLKVLQNKQKAEFAVPKVSCFLLKKIFY